MGWGLDSPVANETHALCHDAHDYFDTGDYLIEMGLDSLFARKARVELRCVRTSLFTFAMSVHSGMPAGAFTGAWNVDTMSLQHGVPVGMPAGATLMDRGRHFLWMRCRFILECQFVRRSGWHSM